MVTAALVVSVDASWAEQLTTAAVANGLWPMEPQDLVAGQSFVTLAAGLPGDEVAAVVEGAVARAALPRGVLAVACEPFITPRSFMGYSVHVMTPHNQAAAWRDVAGQAELLLAPGELCPVNAQVGLWARGQIASVLDQWLSSGVWLRRVTNDLEFAQAFNLRYEVFVDEQLVPPEEELDPLDVSCEHVILTDSGVLVGTGRLIRPPRSGGVWHLGRIAVAASRRGEHLGQAIVHGLEQLAVGLTNDDKPVVAELAAQQQAAGFYEKLGYQLFGPVFLDGGIEHRQAHKVLRA